MISTSSFEWTVAFVIFANCISIGLQADYMIRNPSNTDLPVYYDIAEACMLGFFTIELGLRLVASGRSFFDRENLDVGWNIFDLLVAWAYGELLLGHFGLTLG